MLTQCLNIQVTKFEVNTEQTLEKNDLSRNPNSTFVVSVTELSTLGQKAWSASVGGHLLKLKAQAKVMTVTFREQFRKQSYNITHILIVSNKALHEQCTVK